MSAPPTAPVEESTDQPVAQSGRPGVLKRLGAALLLFALLEAGIFHSGLYESIVQPDSSAGRVITILTNERRRQIGTPHQILTVGDSRMSFRPKVAHAYTAGSGYRFANIMVPGTTLRCWYYMLREVDPARNRYAAVILPIDDYDDDDWENLAERAADLSYLAPLLRLSDLVEFTSSFQSWALRWEAFRTVLLRGWAYNRDFQALLSDYPSRRGAIEWVLRESAQAFYDHVPTSRSLKGLRVDYATRTIHYPPGLTDFDRQGIEANLLRPTVPPTGRRAAYRRKWLGKIAAYYRGTRTRLIVMRGPRGPVVRPDLAVDAGSSSIREMAARGDFLLMNEKIFDELERPEMYADGVHLNNQGSLRFTHLIADETIRLLGPARAARQEAIGPEN